MAALIEMRNIQKRYTDGDTTVRALDGVNLTVEAGELVAILGRSGSGKSTLMNILGCLDAPTSGSYRLAEHAVERLNEARLSAIRNREIGFVFQGFHLLPDLTALENVELPLVYRGVPERQRRQLARQMLHTVGLEERLSHRPHQLSGGQQQRVAIARALAGNPPLLLADEPTGNLDTAAGQGIMALLRRLHRAGTTVLIITHDPAIGNACPRQLMMADGKLSE